MVFIHKPIMELVWLLLVVVIVVVSVVRVTVVVGSVVGIVLADMYLKLRSALTTFVYCWRV